jgi:type IV secretory pathway protease TraF
MELLPPQKGFTKAEREWIAKYLIPNVKTVHAIQGRNVSISDTEQGQVINADDCAPCP